MIERFSSYACVVFAAILLSTSLFNMLFGVIYDTEHFADTLFLLGSGWRVMQGLEPVLDFNHFYAGFIAKSLGWAMWIFGKSASVIYFFSISLALFLVLFLAITEQKRSSSWTFCMASFVILTLMLSRYPLELNSPIVEVLSAHSFLYNRFAQAAMLVVAIFVSSFVKSAKSEVIGGIVSGLLVGSVCLTKTTFVVIIPGLILALILGARWAAAAGAIAGISILVAIFDPTLSRYFGALNYALAQVGEGNDVAGLIRKSVQVVLNQPIALGITLLAVVLCLNDPPARRVVFSSVVFAGSLAAMSATMGGNGSLGQLILPTFIGVALGCAEISRQRFHRAADRVQLLTIVLVFGFSVPHVVNTVAAAVEGYTRRAEILVHSGPYSRYLSAPRYVTAGSATQYEMFADGISALHHIETSRDWGVISNMGITFEHALRSKPVAEYPLWQRETAPEFSEDRSFGDEVDIVLISRLETGVGRILRSRLTNKFHLCMTTEHWDIFLHDRRDLSKCLAVSEN